MVAGVLEATPCRRADACIEHDNERSEASGRFPCLKDITGTPYVARAVESGRASVAFIPRYPEGAEWVDAIDCQLLVGVDGEVLGRRGLRTTSGLVESLAKSVARSKRQALDYAVRNRLGLLWTFTYAEQTWDRKKVIGDMNGFMKRWRDYQGNDFPYLYTLEHHKSGAYHVHVIVPRQMFTNFFAMVRLWGRGRPNFKKRSDASSRAATRAAARYVTKYITKDVAVEIPAGGHRYEVAQGFQPWVESQRFESYQDAYQFLLVKCPDIEPTWWSNDDATWQGPPVWCYDSP